MARYADYGFSKFPPYVPVHERRARAFLEVRKLEKRGRILQPVKLDAKRIADTFWGKEWCRNLESYMDFSNRLPRGRTYVRSGAVVDLRIAKGQVDALVAGSSIYEVAVRIGKLPRKRWAALIKRCGGRIDSAVELLRGRLPETVLTSLVDRESGVFPAPKEIDFTCSCPDYASMCKHVAAVLYGVGARLDRQPELFFTLRSVAAEDLVTRSALRPKRAADEIDAGALEAIFGIELEPRPRRRRSRRRASPQKASASPS